MLETDKKILMAIVENKGCHACGGFSCLDCPLEAMCSNENNGTLKVAKRLLKNDQQEARHGSDMDHC